jgi:predicted AAA+ superfamily ATPase
VFFDEIQECPEARTAMKFLVEDGRFDYIESGSLLGVNYKEVQSYPVGYEETIRMYPMDFEEFALANGVQTETLLHLKECFDKRVPVNDAIHGAMSDLFMYYVIVGGMPAVVQSFVDTHDIGEVLKIQMDILAMYRQDITKYSQNDKIRIKDIFDRIPSELSTQNRRFKLSDISKTARMNRYESSFVWLADAGVALPCYNITEPKAPLRLNEQSSLFRLYMCDTGLLCAAGTENVQFDILNGDLTVNMGGILENAFAQLLKSGGFELRYMNKKNLGEIDFVLQRGKAVVPVEVKSGSGYKTHAALNNVMRVPEWNIDNAYVFCMGNVEARDNITYLPWYMVMFFKQERLPAHLIVDVALDDL